MYKLENVINHAYSWVPESMTFDKQKDKVKVPDYQLGCKEQQALAKTKDGSLPLF